MNDAQEKVKIPALVIMITGGIGILFQCVMGVINIIGMLGSAAVAADAKDANYMAQAFSGGVTNIIFSVFSILCGAAIIFGAFQMKSLKMYGLALTAAILSVIPCTSPCCCLTIAPGVWAIIVLMDQNVKTAFR